MRLRRFEFSGAPHPVLPDADPRQTHRERVDGTLSGGAGDQTAGLKLPTDLSTLLCVSDRLVYGAVFFCRKADQQKHGGKFYRREPLGRQNRARSPLFE